MALRLWKEGVLMSSVIPAQNPDGDYTIDINDIEGAKKIKEYLENKKNHTRVIFVDGPRSQPRLHQIRNISNKIAYVAGWSLIGIGGLAVLAAATGAFSLTPLGWAALGCAAIYVVATFVYQRAKIPPMCTVVGGIAQKYRETRNEREAMPPSINTSTPSSGKDFQETLVVYKGDRFVSSGNVARIINPKQQQEFDMLPVKTRARMYAEGNNEYLIKKNPLEAAKLYIEAMSKEKPGLSHYELPRSIGACYEPKKANYLEAHRYMALAYATGNGVDKDLEKAKSCYELVLRSYLAQQTYYTHIHQSYPMENNSRAGEIHEKKSEFDGLVLEIEREYQGVFLEQKEARKNRGDYDI
jgi:hypothetical protein